MNSPRIVGPDGKPLGPQKISADDLCVFIVHQYIQQMAAANITVDTALGLLVGHATNELVKLVIEATKGKVVLAGEPVKHLLREIAAVCSQYGFRIEFRFGYNEPVETNAETKKERKDVTDVSTRREVQDSSNQKNNDGPQESGPSSPLCK